MNLSTAAECSGVAFLFFCTGVIVEAHTFAYDPDVLHSGHTSGEFWKLVFYFLVLYFNEETVSL